MNYYGERNDKFAMIQNFRIDQQEIAVAWVER